MSRTTLLHAAATTALLTATAVACAPARRPLAPHALHAARRPAVPQVTLDEDRSDNPFPEWITADWADTNRSTRAQLVAYAKSANAWTQRCKRGFAALDKQAGNIDARVEHELAAIPRSGSPYDAFDAFRAVEAHFVHARDRMVHDRHLGVWEERFLLQPIEHRIRVGLLEWENRFSPLLMSAAGTIPLGIGMPVAMGAQPGGNREALYCRHARDRGTSSAPSFFAPSGIRGLVRRPFEATAPPNRAIRRAPSPTESPWSVEGVVKSVSKASQTTRVTFEYSWKMFHRRPPCHIERCTGIDCGMVPGGRMRRICREVEVTSRVRFVALFSSLPRGLVLRAGDRVSFFAAEQFRLTPPYQRRFHAIILQWVERPHGKRAQFLFSLGPD